LEEEKNHFIDVVTTHHTAFFRESEHFDFLAREASRLVGSGGTIEVLSAACSTGEEVWSIGMTLAEALRTRRFIVHGCDISLRALHTARMAIYSEESLKAVPAALQKRWFMRSRERERRVVRVVPELRELASFSLVNLSEATLHLGRRFDAIFLRNVLIYFEREMQQKILSRIVALLSSGGWLFVGTAESAEGFALPLERIQQSIYRRLA
jgi:chemotaxis protein methyltransferase CheR